MKKRFTEEQIIGFLKEADRGVAVPGDGRHERELAAVSAAAGSQPCLHHQRLAGSPPESRTYHIAFGKFTEPAGTSVWTSA